MFGPRDVNVGDSVVLRGRSGPPIGATVYAIILYGKNGRPTFCYQLDEAREPNAWAFFDQIITLHKA